jgi:hypothetical protein
MYTQYPSGNMFIEKLGNVLKIKEKSHLHKYSYPSQYFVEAPLTAITVESSWVCLYQLCTWDFLPFLADFLNLLLSSMGSGSEQQS